MKNNLNFKFFMNMNKCDASTTIYQLNVIDWKLDQIY